MELEGLICYLIKNRKIKGKKALQKLVYFCLESGVPVDCSFRMYLYGPYSSELAEEINESVDKGILCIKADGYTFEKGANCDYFYKQNEKDIAKYKKTIDRVIENFSGFSPMMLELHATVHFIAATHNQIYGEIEKQKVLQEVYMAKGKKFDKEQIEKAFDDLVKWNMIQNKTISLN
ncbi:MAG: hypothetical protein NUV45_13280 [Tepidanaerobacteraceae bacterium]|jgi:uncharacterized protein YwgA|nr:hypothetical protein [Tepidanaerobacteraceae bacterium]